MLPLQDLHPRLLTARDLLQAERLDGVERLATHFAPLDEVLHGGLPRGWLVEIVGHRSCGRFSTLLATLASVTGTGRAAALVDLGDALDPQAAASAGVELRRLLWLRPPHLKQALMACEMLLHSAFPLVAIDLGTPPVPGGRGVEAAWVRLARTAERHRSTLLLSSPYRASGTAAAAVVATRLSRAHWHGRGTTPRLLDGLTIELCLEKFRGRSDRDLRSTGHLQPAVADLQHAAAA